MRGRGPYWIERVVVVAWMFGAAAFFWSWVGHGLGYGYVFLVVWVNLGFVLGGLCYFYYRECGSRLLRGSVL